jgi:hypothetical protein
MNVPPAIAKAMEPLTTAAPLLEAMERLVISEPADPARLELAAKVVQNPVIQANPTLCAGVWLYVDALDRSHTISQGVKDATGSFWHGIMHRREGDFSNSHYWFHRTGDHPAMADIAGYDPHAFIDQVEDRSEAHPPALVAMQRREWQTLFEWCANR